MSDETPLERLLRLAAPLGRTVGKPYASSLLPPSKTAPGAKPVYDYRMKHVPSQTQQASPPLPPRMSVPTPEELESFAQEIDTASGNPQIAEPAQATLRGAARQTRSAALAIRHGNPIEALYRLRSAQTGIYSAHNAYNGENLPVANVWSVTLNPAEQSSARSAMSQTVAMRNNFRRLSSLAAQHIDRIRRAFFHGLFPPGYPSGWGTGTAKLTGELELSDRLVKGYERYERGKLEHVRPHQEGFKDGQAMGRIVHVGGQTLIGDRADEAIDKGVAKGEYGEKNGNFLDSNGEKHWGWWGGAGLLVRHVDPKTAQARYLLQKRSYGVQNGGTWSTPGGAVERVVGEDGKKVPETPEQAARREAEEEFGAPLPAGTAHVETRTKTWGTGKGAWSYHTVIMQSPQRFNPEGEGGLEGVHDTKWESSGYAWVTPAEMAGLPLHPAFRQTAEELGMPKGGGQTPPPPKPSYKPRPDMPDDYRPGDKVTWRHKGETVTGVVQGPSDKLDHGLPESYRVKAPGGEFEVKWGQLRLAPKEEPKAAEKAVDQYSAAIAKASGGEQFKKGDRVNYYGTKGTVVATGRGSHVIKFDNGAVHALAVGSPGLKRA